MIPVRDLRIDTFLPLARMQAEADAARAAYAAAKPYPHVVFDNFFDPALVDEVLAEFPRPKDIPWQKFDNGHEIKLMSVKEASFGPATRLLFYHLNSATFLDFLSHVTAIPNLIPDPGFEGGGLHQILRGGKLGVHADFNKHGQYNLDRRLNLLLYLNKDWKEEYGGNLELWDRDMTRCETQGGAALQPDDGLRHHRLHLPRPPRAAAMPRGHDPQVHGVVLLQQRAAARGDQRRAFDPVPRAARRRIQADRAAAHRGGRQGLPAPDPRPGTQQGFLRRESRRRYLEHCGHQQGVSLMKP